MSKKNIDQKNYNHDVDSIDAIINAYYESVCYEPGQERDWDRDKTLHHDQASVVILNDVESIPKIQTLSEYQADRRNKISPAGFYERELHRVTQQHGNITHVWSTYETRLTKEGPVAHIGVNSIQLVFCENRWYITNWMFDGRKSAPKIDEKYMP